MKSLQRRFANLQEARPILSSYINFAGAVKEGKFSPRIIRYWFNRLVEKDDWAGMSKIDLFCHLDSLTNPLRTT